KCHLRRKARMHQQHMSQIMKANYWALAMVSVILDGVGLFASLVALEAIKGTNGHFGDVRFTFQCGLRSLAEEYLDYGAK
ncbi:hypothetical protein M8C21_028390, partial [Ambrosia artemisiifolia]